MVAGFAERAFGLGAVGDVAADALQIGRPVGVGAHQRLAPGDPPRPEPGRHLLVVNPGAVRLMGGVALLEHVQRETAADQRRARLLRQGTERVVDEGDDAVGIAQHDQVALGFEQAAGALLGFLQFPVAVGQRLVVQGDLAQPGAHPAQPHAQGGERDAGDRKQHAGADREQMRLVARIAGAAAGDESVGAAERGREDHERAHHEGEPRMAAGKPADAMLDQEKSRYHVTTPEIVVTPDPVGAVACGGEHASPMLPTV